MKDGATDISTNPVEFLKIRKPNEEEMQVYNNCLSGAFFKTGLPFAMVSYFLSAAMRKPGSFSNVSSWRFLPSDHFLIKGNQPRSFIKSSIIFLANSLFGTFLLVPVCYSKFSSIYMKNIKKEQDEGAEGNISATQLTDETLPPSSVEDFSYPIDAITQFNEPDSNFSGDFSYSRLLEDDSNYLPAKSQTTTYSELRARHRNEQTNPSTTPGSSLNVDSRKAPSTLSTPVSRAGEKKEPLISPHPVRKNMYGDEIE